MGKEEFAFRVNHFGFPSRLVLVMGTSMPFIRFQRCHLQVFGTLILKGFPMFTGPNVHTPHHAHIHAHQGRCAFQTTPFSQMLRHGDGFGFRYLCVPQGSPLTFAEFCAATATMQITNTILSRSLANTQVVLSLLSVQLARRIDTC